MRATSWLSNAIIALAAIASMAHGEDQMPWQPNLETARQIAVQTNRLVLIHFWAPKCEPCARVEREVFSRAETAKALEPNFVMVKLNAWDDAPGTARLYGVSTLPTDVVIAPNGRLVCQLQSPSNASQYIAQMNQAANGYRELVRNATQQQQTTARAAVAAAQGAATTNAVASAAPAGQTPANNASGVTVTAATAPIAAPPAGAPIVASDQLATQNTAATYTAPPAAPAAPAAGDRYAEYFRQQQQQQQQQTQSAVPQAAAQPQIPGQPPASPYAAQPNAAPAAPASPYAAPVGAQPPVAAQASAYAPAGVAAAQLAPPAGPQLPPGVPAVGLYGYCPVTLVESKQWALGDKAYGAVHRGRTYLFLGPAEKEKFLANPERYCPVLSGNDPVLALDNQMVVAGRRETGVFGPDGRIYLFANEASMVKFEQNPKRYAADAVQAMR